MVRYVGKTNNLKKRLHEHLTEITGNTHKENWIHQLKALGLKPIIEVLEDVDEDTWQEAERFWIETLKFYGCKLTNSGNGGMGLGKHSQETKQKLRVLHLGRKHSEETKFRISLINKGRLVSEETRLKLSTAFRGRKITQQQIEKFKTTISNRSKERKAEISEKSRLINLGNQHHKGHHHSEEAKTKISTVQKHRWENYRKAAVAKLQI